MDHLKNRLNMHKYKESWVKCPKAVDTSQWRIQDFPLAGGAEKVCENERIGSRWEGGRRRPMRHMDRLLRGITQTSEYSFNIDAT